MSAIPSWARVGARVVCVDATELAGPGAWTPLEQNAVYTIRSIDNVMGVGVRLREVVRPEWFGWEPTYLIRRFRPLVDDEAQERDVALFRKLLTTRQPEAA